MYELWFLNPYFLTTGTILITVVLQGVARMCFFLTNALVAVRASAILLCRVMSSFINTALIWFSMSTRLDSGFMVRNFSISTLAFSMMSLVILFFLFTISTLFSATKLRHVSPVQFVALDRFLTSELLYLVDKIVRI